MRLMARIDVHPKNGTTIAVELAGEPGGRPLLLCHGLVDSRLEARLLEPLGRSLGLRIIAPDRPGTGESGFRRLHSLRDWADDVAAVLDALEIDQTAVLGQSAGGPFAAACAAALPDRVRSLLLISPLGPPGWATAGMSPGERFGLAVSRRAPAFSGWFLGRLAVLGRRSPKLFARITTSELPEVDRVALNLPEARAAFLAGYLEAFRQGTRGVTQDLRLLGSPWGFELEQIAVPTWVHHGDADRTVPLEHARRYAAAIPGAELHLHPGHGHFSLLDSALDSGAGQILAPAT